MATSIEWTDETWNPLRGCRRISPGCENCYAERQAARPILSGPGLPYEGLVTIGKQGPRWTGATAGPDLLDLPLRWKKPRKVFPCSMSDLFFKGHSDEQIAVVFGVMAATPQHTYQVLTKRPERAAAWLNGRGRELAAEALRALAMAGKLGMAWVRGPLPMLSTWPLPNVWIGTSVEDQQRADERLPHLHAVPAAVRFVSYEPALGAVDFRPWLKDCTSCRRRTIDWIIVGGESGPGARPFHLEWARDVVRACQDVGVPVFVKQLGALPVMSEDEWRDASKQRLLNHRARGVPADTVAIRLVNRKGAEPDEWPVELREQEIPGARA